MKKTRFLIKSILLLLIVLPSVVRAQKADTLVLYREFIRACNVYQHMPLHLELEIKSSANFITSEDDTSIIQGEFYLKPEGSYIQMGEMEQIVNDSLALVISNKLQRMMLYENEQSTLLYMKAMSGLQLKDSSILEISQKYTAHSLEAKIGVSAIQLISRSFLYSTTLPEGILEIQYDAKTKNPLEVMTLKRMLLPLDEEDYKTLQAQHGMEANLLSIVDNGYYLIKEIKTSFLYKKIEHDPAMKVPIAMSDRISKNKNGGYVTVKGYENYEITTD